MAGRSGGSNAEKGRQTKNMTGGSMSASCAEPQVRKFAGNIVDVLHRNIFPGVLIVADGRIVSLHAETSVRSGPFILPGLVDAHVHVESTMVTPAEFARAATVCGVVGAVSDPHEIANVLGLEGIEYMLASGSAVPFDFAFGAPSCVPATVCETAGAELGAAEVETLLSRPEIKYLSEVMNVPGVVRGEPEVLRKIRAALRLGKKVDGHAPGLTGEPLQRYAAAGISTDHECIDLAEAEEKIAAGMHILIREGSTAKNFDRLVPLLACYPHRCMFCTDDLHPDDLVNGSINNMVRRALRLGYNRMDVLAAATVNPVCHYSMDSGLLRPGDRADFIVVDDFDSFAVRETYLAGRLVADRGVSLIAPPPAASVNYFVARPRRVEDFRVAMGKGPVNTIRAFDGQLFTDAEQIPPLRQGKYAVPDPSRDLLKITVVNRYREQPPAVGFVRGFGLKTGAIASSVAHDSHNIVAVGADDLALCEAVNAVIEHRGGLAVRSGSQTLLFPLPIAGLMSDRDAWQTAALFKQCDHRAKDLGCVLSAPFMTLSFMALLVIPSLKLSDRGLFDGMRFSFVDLFSAG